jgi:cadmium resistance protein CadD (predicted permease)
MLAQVEALSLAFVACAGTNVDNVALLLSTGDPERARRFAQLFFVILATVVLAALGLSFGVELILPAFLAWVGIVPLAMGLFAFLPRKKTSGENPARAMSLIGTATLLGANSLDTLAVQMALFSDLATAYHAAALIGSLVSAALLSTTAFVLLSHPKGAVRLIPLASRARPWILIAVGILLLMDTGFDIQ